MDISNAVAMGLVILACSGFIGGVGYALGVTVAYLKREFFDDNDGE